MGSMDLGSLTGGTSGSAGSSTDTIKNQIAAAIGDAVESAVKAVLGNMS